MFALRDSLLLPGIFKPKHPKLPAFSVEDRQLARPLSTLSWPPASSSSHAGTGPRTPAPSAFPPRPPSPPSDRLCKSVGWSTLRRWPVWSNQNQSPFFLTIFFFLKSYLSVLLKDQILEKVCGIKTSGDRFAEQRLWPVSLVLLSVSLGKGCMTRVVCVGDSGQQ